jgi:hypothetical protein
MPLMGEDVKMGCSVWLGWDAHSVVLSGEFCVAQMAAPKSSGEAVTGVIELNRRLMLGGSPAAFPFSATKSGTTKSALILLGS